MVIYGHWLNMAFFIWLLITVLKVVINYFLLKIRMMGEATLSVKTWHKN